MSVKLKGKSLGDWEKWIESELTPPIIAKPETVHVLEALRDAIAMLKRLSPVENERDDLVTALKNIEELTVDLEYYGPGESPIGAAKKIAHGALTPHRIRESIKEGHS